MRGDGNTTFSMGKGASDLMMEAYTREASSSGSAAAQATSSFPMDPIIGASLRTANSAGSARFAGRMGASSRVSGETICL